jgi:hypothetical protein
MKKIFLSTLLLTFTFFSLASSVNAASIHQECLQGNDNACVKVREIQMFYEFQKIQELSKHLKATPINYPDPDRYPDLCDPRNGPVPKWCWLIGEESFDVFDGLRINRNEYKKLLFEIADHVDRRIENLDKFK